MYRKPTNLIKNLNSKIQNYKKNKMSFSTDDAVLKSVYLCFKRSYKKSSMPIQNLVIAINQFMLIFNKGSDYKIQALTF